MQMRHRAMAPRPSFAMPPKPAQAAPKPVAHSANAGLRPFRRYHRGIYDVGYPVTFTGDAAYYGAPYDPTDVPLPIPPSAGDVAPVTTAPAEPVVREARGCRAQHLMVPNASRRGESEITVIRC